MSDCQILPGAYTYANPIGCCGVDGVGVITFLGSFTMTICYPKILVLEGQTSLEHDNGADFLKLQNLDESR